MSKNLLLTAAAMTMLTASSASAAITYPIDVPFFQANRRRAIRPRGHR
jgi:hypothetical protein